MLLKLKDIHPGDLISVEGTTKIFTVSGKASLRTELPETNSHQWDDIVYVTSRDKHILVSDILVRHGLDIFFMSYKYGGKS